MDAQGYLFILFAVLVGGFLIADLGFFNKTAHRISTKSALYQTLFWIVLAVIFGALIYGYMSPTLAAEFYSAYVTEKLLSVDNLFVILLIFRYFKLEEKYYHRVLFWGILGAIVLRGVFILAGSYVIDQFHWVLYIFGAILVYTGIKLLKNKHDEHIDIEHNKVLVLARKLLPFTTKPHDGHFFIKEAGKTMVTTLFLIVLLVESTDVVFAVDSIPAAFSVSQHPFIVFTSNIFAVMGLRALFFLIESVVHKFHYLQKGLAFILIYIGGKMLADIFGFHLSSLTSFAIIMGTLGLSLLLSVMFPEKVLDS